MSAERQEGFEAEMAQIQARLELHRLRKARQAEVSLKDITQDPMPYKVIFLSFRLSPQIKVKISRISAAAFMNKTVFKLHFVRTAPLDILLMTKGEKLRQVRSRIPITNAEEVIWNTEGIH